MKARHMEMEEAAAECGLILLKEDGLKHQTSQVLVQEIATQPQVKEEKWEPDVEQQEWWRLWVSESPEKSEFTRDVATQTTTATTMTTMRCPDCYCDWKMKAEGNL